MSQKSAQFKLQPIELCAVQKKRRCATTVFLFVWGQGKSQEAFLRKWDKYKALEAILNTGNFDISLEGLDIGRDKEKGVILEGQKSIVSIDKQITAVEEHNHSDSTADVAAIQFFKNWQATDAVCPSLTKSLQRKSDTASPLLSKNARRKMNVG